MGGANPSLIGGPYKAQGLVGGSKEQLSGKGGETLCENVTFEPII